MLIFHLAIMLVLCLMLFSTYCAQNYVSIIGAGLTATPLCYTEFHIVLPNFKLTYNNVTS